MSWSAAAFFMALTAPIAQGDLCPLVAELNRSIAAATPYAPPACPVIGFAQLPQSGGLRSQAGAFNPETGAIELAPDLDLTGAFGKSFLLHELVHAAQYANGAQHRARCAASLEAEAYTVQAAYLREAGLAREAVMVRLMADLLGTCAD